MRKSSEEPPTNPRSSGVGVKQTKRTEYRMVVDCYGSTLTSGFDAYCSHAMSYCDRAQPGSLGPLMQIWRREVMLNGTGSTPWTMVGRTCFPNAVPAVVRPRPVLTLAMVREAWSHTPWAKPGVHIQPEGNITLVTLPTYFEVTWPSAGFQPGEINTVTLLGYQVRIRPTLQGYTYRFGDGTGFGPTTSPGGRYPNGDITHAYPTRGIYSTHVDITYGGELSVNGGEWIRIPDTTTIAGPPQTLTVKIARNRLVLR